MWLEFRRVLFRSWGINDIQQFVTDADIIADDVLNIRDAQLRALQSGNKVQQGHLVGWQFTPFHNDRAGEKVALKIAETKFSAVLVLFLGFQD